MLQTMSRLRRELLVVLVIAAGLLALSARQVRSELLLSRHAQEGRATVVSKQSHAWVGYTYVVNSVTYEGSAPAPAAVDHVNLGDKFPIVFDPTHPDVSGTAETREVVLSTVPFLLLATIVAVGIVFVRNYRPVA